MSTEAKPPRRVFRTARHLVRITAVVALAIVIADGTRASKTYIAGQAANAVERLSARYTTVRTVREMVPVKEVPLPELARTLALEHRISYVVVEAILDQEDARHRDEAQRFEPKVYADLRAAGEKGTDEHVKMLASSHGPMQVLGITARRVCRMSWAELYTREKNVRCGLMVLKDNMARLKSLRASLRAYNGSGPKAERYAEQVMARIAEKLMEGK